MSVETLVAFLDAIAPQGGLRCLFTLPDRRHYWSTSSLDLARMALTLDARKCAVFHGNATFRERKREQVHVHSIGVFWFDIDAGPGKPYATAGDAYRALEAWRTARGLPAPLVVSSGGGLHVYWPLRDPLEPRLWLDGSHRLRAAAQAAGLAIDAGSSIDAARILRPPGTTNRKLLDAAGKKLADVGGPDRPVRCGPLVGPYDASTILACLSSATIKDETAGLGSIPSYMGGVDTAALEAGVVNERTFEDSNPHAVADRCAQVSRMRAAGGRVPEPEWYAVLGVLAHCGPPGRAAAHDFSRADERYSFPDTERKLDHALASAGPTTCERFRVLNPEGCALCPYAGNVSSPIQLGRNLPASQVAPAPPKLELPLLPDPYFWKGSRLAIRTEDAEGKAIDIIVSEYPVYMSELQEAERSRAVSAVLRSWEPMRGAWRDFSSGLGEVIGRTGRSKVADQGVMIAEKRWLHFSNFITSMSNHLRGTRHYGTRYEQFGWKLLPTGPGFVLGHELLTKGQAPQRIHGTEEVERRALLMAPRGELARWVAASERLLQPQGVEAHQFMLLAALGALLYQFTGEVGCTFVHGYSRETGSGKTTAQMLGATVLGMMDATSIIERDTAVAKFMTLGVLNNLPVFFDECRFLDPEEGKAYVLQATLGRDKQRGKSDGSGLRSDHLPWSTIHVSAANQSLVDTVRYNEAEVAHAARIFEFEIQLPKGLSASEGDRLKDALKENAGQAGRVFVQFCLDHYEWVAAAVKKQMRFWEDRLAAGPEQRFITRLFACADVAGVIARACKLTTLDSRRVLGWAQEIQQGNATRLAQESKLDAVAVLSRMMSDLWSSTLFLETGVHATRPSATVVVRQSPRGELRARFEADSRQYLVRCDVVRGWMQEHNFSYSTIQKELVVLGVLKDPRARRTLGAGVGQGAGQDWCWHVDGRHLLLADAIDLVTETAKPETNVVPFRGKP